MRLWIDDERPMPADYTVHAKTSAEAIQVIRNHRVLRQVWESVSFDHDLGFDGSWDDTTRTVLLYMIENNLWPQRIYIHTANPVGREWLLGTAQQYAPAWVEVIG